MLVMKLALLRRLLVGSAFGLLAIALLAWVIRPTPVTAPLAWRTSHASGPQGSALVRNFGAVEQGILYRSAQPRLWDLLWVRSLGIRSIVNLREAQYDDGVTMLAWLGIPNYLSLAIDNHAPPTDAQAIGFLQFVQDQRNWPVLVHCAQGEGRTGTLVALTRYAIDGWTMEQALSEANKYADKIALSNAQRAWLIDWARKHAPGDQRAAASFTGRQSILRPTEAGA